MAAAKQKPFYSAVATEYGYAVQANGAPLKTPVGNRLTVPTEKLAEAIAAEWRYQPDKINPASMPLTQLTATTLDIISKDRAKIIDQMIAYVGSELLCHHADHPDALKDLQKREWQPLLDWCALRFNALLQSGPGIMPISQSHQAQYALRKTIESYDDFYLTGLRHAVDTCGSLILGLALAEKHLGNEQVLATAELDANFQMLQWGEDPDITKRQSDMRRELDVCEVWFGLLA